MGKEFFLALFGLYFEAKQHFSPSAFGTHGPMFHMSFRPVEKI